MKCIKCGGEITEEGICEVCGGNTYYEDHYLANTQYEQDIAIEMSESEG